MNQKHIIFMGTPAIAAKVLQALIDSDVSVDLVVTQPDKQVGRKKRSCSVKSKRSLKNIKSQSFSLHI